MGLVLTIDGVATIQVRVPKEATLAQLSELSYLVTRHAKETLGDENEYSITFARVSDTSKPDYNKCHYSIDGARFMLDVPTIDVRERKTLRDTIKQLAEKSKKAVEAELPEDEPDFTAPWVYECIVRTVLKETGLAVGLRG